MNRIEHLKTKGSILLIVGLLLAAIPMTTFAEKGQAGGGSGSATPSSAERAEDDVLDDDDASDEEGVWNEEDEELENDISVATPSEADREDKEDEKFEEDFFILATPNDAVPMQDKEMDLIGIWTIDGVTSYQFKEDGEGALLLPEKKYGFTYTLNGDQLFIDFTSRRASDGIYTVTVEGELLILESGEGTIGGTYELYRQEE